MGGNAGDGNGTRSWRVLDVATSAAVRAPHQTPSLHSNRNPVMTNAFRFAPDTGVLQHRVQQHRYTAVEIVGHSV